MSKDSHFTGQQLNKIPQEEIRDTLSQIKGRSKYGAKTVQIERRTTSLLDCFAEMQPILSKYTAKINK